MNIKNVAVNRQRRVRHVWVRQLLLVLSVIGPGLITTNVDNNATGITGYSVERSSPERRRGEDREGYPRGTVAQPVTMCYAT